MTNPSVPTNLSTALAFVETVERIVGENHALTESHIRSILGIFFPLQTPLLYLPQALSTCSRELSNARMGPYKGDALTTIEEALMTLRMQLERTIKALTVPKQDTIALPSTDIPQGEPVFWALGSMHIAQYKAIQDATLQHRLSEDGLRALLGRGTVGGVVETRDGHVTAGLIRELRYSQKGDNDNLLHDIAIHPAVPEAGESLLRHFLPDFPYPLRMAVRKNRDALRHLLLSLGFKEKDFIDNFYRDGDQTMGAYCMERMPGPLSTDTSE